MHCPLVANQNVRWSIALQLGCLLEKYESLLTLQQSGLLVGKHEMSMLCLQVCLLRCLQTTHITHTYLG